VGVVGSGLGLTPSDLQVVEEAMVPREVEVETRVNPLPSYLAKYEMNVLGAGVGADPGRH